MYKKTRKTKTKKGEERIKKQNKSLKDIVLNTVLPFSS